MFAIKAVLVCVVGLAMVTLAEDDVPAGNSKLKKLCSVQLHQAYVLACLGASQMLGKRSSISMPAFDAINSVYDNALEAEHADWPSWPWLESHQAHNRMVSHPRLGKRFYRGLADECCAKPCYMEELLSYCP